MFTGVTSRNSSSSTTGNASGVAPSNGTALTGVNGGAYAHVTATGILSAAQALCNFIQQSGNVTPAPDPITAGIIHTWLDTHLPVSGFGLEIPAHLNND